MAQESKAIAIDPMIQYDPITLDQMERHLIGALKAVWKAQGVEKRIVIWNLEQEREIFGRG